MNRPASQATLLQRMVFRLQRSMPGMFNLNDPRWGRGDDTPSGDKTPPEVPRGESDDSNRQPPRGQRPDSQRTTKTTTGCGRRWATTPPAWMNSPAGQD